MSILFNKHGILLPIFMYLWVSVFCTDPEKCYLNSKTKSIEEERLLNRISPLFGQTFRTAKDGGNFIVAICSDASRFHTNVSVIGTKSKNETYFLGYRNQTSLDGGDKWVMLRYECLENMSDSKCHGHHSSSIYIVCNPEKIDEPSDIKLTENDGCNYKFVLSSSIVCESEEDLSGTTIFCLLFSLGFIMYFVIGIIYRRLVRRAQGCHQLPHYMVWQKTGAFLSDGCNYLCRCDAEPENSWNNVTSNFDNSDPDYALLRP